MENKIISILEKDFNISETDLKILKKPSGGLDRQERRYYFQQLKPREKEFKEVLQRQMQYWSREEKEEIQNALVRNLLDKKGDPSIADKLLMDVMGRLEIYRQVRETSESEGIALKALNNFGGFSMVIILFGVITAIVLYFVYR